MIECEFYPLITAAKMTGLSNLELTSRGADGRIKIILPGVKNREARLIAPDGTIKSSVTVISDSYGEARVEDLIAYQLDLARVERFERQCPDLWLTRIKRFDDSGDYWDLEHSTMYMGCWSMYVLESDINSLRDAATGQATTSEIEPEQTNQPGTDAPAQSEEKPLTDSEKTKLLKQIGLLALVLSEKSNQYKIGDRPNVSQIANGVKTILDALEVVGRKGVEASSMRDSIAKGLDLLYK